MSQDLKAAKSETSQKQEPKTYLNFSQLPVKRKGIKKKGVGVQFNAKKTRLASETVVELLRKFIGVK